MERTFRITVENSVYTVTVEELGTDALQSQSSCTSAVSPAAVPLTQSTNDRTSTLAAEDLKCRLGGVVDSIEVTLGQTVNKGDKVVVVEAMKMKTPMFATRSGVVSRIAVKVGEKVDTGQVLINIA
jgi:biotin carboxyl carrier protein